MKKTFSVAIIGGLMCNMIIGSAYAETKLPKGKICNDDCKECNHDKKGADCDCPECPPAK